MSDNHFSEFVNPYDGEWPNKGSVGNDNIILVHDVNSDGEMYVSSALNGWTRGSIVFTGKIYLEIIGCQGAYKCGFCDLDITIPDNTGVENAPNSDDRYCIIKSGSIQTNSSGLVPVTGLPTSIYDLMVAIDVDTGEIWLGANGSWINDPATDVATVTITPSLRLSTYFQVAPNGKLPNRKAGGTRDYKYQPPIGFEPQYPKASNTFYVKATSLRKLESRYSPYGVYTGGEYYKTNPIHNKKTYIEFFTSDYRLEIGLASDEYNIRKNLAYSDDIPASSFNTVLKNDHLIITNDGVLNSNRSIRIPKANLGYATLQTATIMVAIDVDTGEVWLGANGVWVNDPATDAATLQLDTGVKWCYFIKGRGASNKARVITPFLESAMRYPLPNGFSPPVPLASVSGKVIGVNGSPVTDAVIKTYTDYDDKVFDESNSDALGNYTISIPGAEYTSFTTCESQSNGLLAVRFEPLNPPVSFDFTYGAGGGEPDPTFKAMIRGNVKKLSIPYGAEIVGVSNTTPPKVVGSTMSDSITGDYELDVAPFQGQVNVMAIPDYGLEFTENAVLPLDAKIRPTVPNGFLYRVTEAGTTGVTEPTWPTIENQVVTSGSVTMITEYMLRPLVNSLLTPVIEPI